MIKKFLFLILLLLLFVYSIRKKRYDAFYPGQKWLDNNGEHINAHGGGIIYHDKKFYWFGEYKVAGKIGNTAQVGVSCYESTDLCNWEFKGIALRVEENTSSEITKGCIIERPKVIYNKKNNKFIMWFHIEYKGEGYKTARCAVAISENIIGPYKFYRSYRPNANTWPINFREVWKNNINYIDTLKWWTPQWKKAVEEGLFVRRDFSTGQMSRDLTVFIDDNGKAYLFYTSEENLTMHVAELTDDYLSFTGKWARILPGGHNEAPTVFKYKNTYYLIMSGCTGWQPNDARLAISDNIWGPYIYKGNPCRGKDSSVTFNSQGTFILKVPGIKNGFIFLADRWVPENPIDGTYLWLPVFFEKELPVIYFFDRWDLSIFNNYKKYLKE